MTGLHEALTGHPFGPLGLGVAQPDDAALDILVINATPTHAVTVETDDGWETIITAVSPTGWWIENDDEPSITPDSPTIEHVEIEVTSQGHRPPGTSKAVTRLLRRTWINLIDRWQREQTPLAISGLAAHVGSIAESPTVWLPLSPLPPR